MCQLVLLFSGSQDGKQYLWQANFGDVLAQFNKEQRGRAPHRKQMETKPVVSIGNNRYRNHPRTMHTFRTKISASKTGACVVSGSDFYCE